MENPKSKFNTKCFNGKGEEVFNWNLNCFSKESAEAYGYAQCYSMTGNDINIKVEVGVL